MTAPAPAAPPALQARAVGGRVCLRARGSSMFPFIPSDSWLLVRPAADRPLDIGDVIVFPGAQGMVTHRIIAIDTSGPTPQLTVRGDARRASEPLSADAVAYVVEAVHRRGITYRTDDPLGQLARHLAVRTPLALRMVSGVLRGLLRARDALTGHPP